MTIDSAHEAKLVADAPNLAAAHGAIEQATAPGGGRDRVRRVRDGPRRTDHHVRAVRRALVRDALLDPRARLRQARVPHHRAAPRH